MSENRDDKGFIKAIHPIDGVGPVGYKFRIYLPEPNTGVMKQVTRQSRHWTYFDAEREYLMLEYMGENYFLKEKKRERSVPVRRDDEGKQLFRLSEVFQLFLEEMETERRESYLDIMRINYNAHIDGLLGSYCCSYINQELIDKWKLELNRKYVKGTNSRLTTHTKNQIIAILRSIWSFAIKKGYTSTVLNISRIKETKRRNDVKTRAYWESDEWYKFIESIPPENLRERTLFMLLLATGARVSEIRSLRESFFNFKTNKVTIEKNLIRRKAEPGKTAYYLGNTKGNDVRVTELDKLIIDNVKKLIELRKEEEGKNYNPKNTFLFSINGKDPISPMSTQRRFNEYKKKAIEKYPDLNADVTIHGLRHSVGTFVANEFGVVAARDMLGHSDLSVTSQYLHGNDDKKTAESIGAKLKNE
ncbi:MAG: tyrosine-type recombinase/integrase [Erysipelotrichaceae bacterium]